MEDTNDENTWKVLYNGTVEPNIFSTTVYGLIPENVYRYRVYAVNRVGTSRAIENTIQIERMMAAPGSFGTQVPATVESNGESLFKVRSVSPITGLVEDDGGRFFLLSIFNPCTLDITGRVCVPVDEESSDYRLTNLLPQSLLHRFTSNDKMDGTYDIPVTFYQRGRYTVTVESLELGGLLGQYWDNQ